MKKFFTELFNRFKMDSPEFFQIISRISALCATVAGLPFLLVNFETELHTKLPDFVHALSNKAMFYAAAISWVISKLTVKDASAAIQKPNSKLPYSKAKE